MLYKNKIFSPFFFPKMIFTNLPQGKRKEKKKKKKGKEINKASRMEVLIGKNLRTASGTFCKLSSLLLIYWENKDSPKDLFLGSLTLCPLVLPFPSHIPWVPKGELWGCENRDIGETAFQFLFSLGGLDLMHPQPTTQATLTAWDPCPNLHSVLQTDNQTA